MTRFYGDCQGFYFRFRPILVQKFCFLLYFFDGVTLLTNEKSRPSFCLQKVCEMSHDLSPYDLFTQSHTHQIIIPNFCPSNCPEQGRQITTSPTCWRSPLFLSSYLIAEPSTALSVLLLQVSCFLCPHISCNTFFVLH